MAASQMPKGQTVATSPGYRSATFETDAKHG